MALQQQFRDSRRRSEISVDLKWSTQVKQVRQCALLQQPGELAKRKIAVSHAPPKRNPPRVAPARAAITPPSQQHFGRSVNFLVRRCNFGPGVEREKRRHVTM